jgi:hypothetical protein
MTVLGGLGSNFITHDIVSGKNINQYRLDFKTFQPKPGNDSYVPLGSVLENKLFAVAELFVLITYLLFFIGKFFYLIYGNKCKRRELVEIIDAIDPSLDKNGMRWYVQSMMESSPKSTVACMSNLATYAIGSVVKTVYIFMYLSPIDASVTYNYPHASNVAVDVGEFAVPVDYLTKGPSSVNGEHVTFNDDAHMKYKTIRAQFIADGGNKTFVGYYTTCVVLFAMSLVIHVGFAMHYHRLDVIRLWREGRMFPNKKDKEGEEKDEKSRGGFMSWFGGVRNRTKGYKTVTGDYDYDDEVESRYFKEEKRKAAGGGSGTSKDDSLKYELVNTYGENFTRLSPLYSRIYFSYGETAFYGIGFLSLLQLIDCLCVLIANTDFTNTAVGLVSVVFGEAVITCFFMATIVFVVFYTIVDGVFFGSQSMSVIYMLLMATSVGTLITFHPKHVNGVYVFLSASLSLFTTFVCFLVHTITSSKHYVQRLDMDRLYHVRKQALPKRFSGISHIVFKND